MKTLRLEIEGMKCDGCAASVRTALESVAGVTDVDVSLDAAAAEIVGDDSVDREALSSAVEEAGYVVSGVR